jgi:hypothetical protein
LLASATLIRDTPTSVPPPISLAFSSLIDLMVRVTSKKRLITETERGEVEKLQNSKIDFNI